MIPHGLRVYFCLEPADMRRSIDGLRKTVMERFGEDASRSLYIFANKRRDRVKLLWAIEGGWCILYERLDRYRIPLPEVAPGTKRVVVEAGVLASLLKGVPRRQLQTARDIAREARKKVGLSTTKSEPGAYREA